MIANNQNKALLILADATKEKPEWREYTSYCESREKGLRKEAFKHLNNFINNTENWNLEQRKDFICRIFSIFENTEDADHGGLPQPLSEKLIEPALLAWCKHENNDSRPFRWYGKYYNEEKYLLKAIEINPFDKTARKTIISNWSFQTYYSVHHLPDYYIGNPYQDLQLCREIKEQISLLRDNQSKEYWNKEINEDCELIENYIEWKESGHPDFDQWGQENKKTTGYNNVRNYYYTE